MRLLFISPDHGQCIVRTRRAGGQGFTMPSVIEIVSAENPAAVMASFTYKNSMKGNPGQRSFTDMEICRFAIAQFLEALRTSSVSSETPLLTDGIPYAGCVTSASQPSWEFKKMAA
jgi:hypothetical protein